MGIGVARSADDEAGRRYPGVFTAHRVGGTVEAALAIRAERCGWPPTSTPRCHRNADCWWAMDLLSLRSPTPPGRVRWSRVKPAAPLMVDTIVAAVVNKPLVVATVDTDIECAQ